MATFDAEAEDSPWRQLLLADALLADGRLTDAFAIYRATLERLPSMVSIHDSVARIYEQTGHADWAATERARGTLSAAANARSAGRCASFARAGIGAALVAALAGTDAESRYWRARAATELALAAFKRVEALPDSRERREVRATLARAERRFADAIVELEAALKFAPGDPSLLDDLGTSYYAARDYEQAVATLLPLLKANPDDARLLTVCGDSLLQLQRLDEAVPMLQRAIARDSSDPTAATGARPRLCPEGRLRRGHSVDRGAARRRPGRQPACAARSCLHRPRTAGERSRSARTVAGDPAGGPGAERSGRSADDHAAEISSQLSALS